MRTPLMSCLVAALLALAPLPAAADQPEEENPKKAAARADGELGLQAFNAGKWQEAFDHFKRAESNYHATTFVLYMAHCQKMLGKLAAARALYREVARERLAPDAPTQFSTAQVVAREEIDRLKKRVGSLKITVKGAPEDRVRVSVDGAPVPSADREAWDVDPGEHVITVEVDGVATSSRSTAREGTVTTVELTVTPPPTAKAPPDKASPEPPHPPKDHPPSLLVPAYVAFGAGALGLGIGTVTGAVSLAQINAVKSRCRPDGHCPVDEKPKAEAAWRLGDASTAAFVFGGASAAAGAVLLVLHLRAHAAPPRKAPVETVVGLGYIGIKGGF